MRAGLTIIGLIVIVMFTVRWPFVGVLSIMLSGVLRLTLYFETYGTFHAYHGVEVLYIATGLSVIIAHPDRLGSFMPGSLIDWGMVGFLIAMVLSAALNGVAIVPHKYIDLFFKALILYLLLSRLADTPNKLTLTVVALIVAMTYQAYLAWKNYRLGYLSYARPYGAESWHHFGLKLIITVPLIGAMALRKRLWLPIRVFLLLLIPFFVLVALRTQSRSAMLGMGVALVLLAWHMRKRWYLMLPLVPLLAYAIAHNPESVLNRLQSIWTHELDGRRDASISSRFEQMRTAERIIRSNPLFGIGPRQFFHRYAQFQGLEDQIRYRDETRYTMHSVPLLILCEEGLVGAAAFALIVLGGLWTSYSVVKRTRGDPELEAVAAIGTGGLMAFISWLAFSLANSNMWIINIYATVALIEASRRVVAAHFATKAAEAPVAPPAPVPWAAGAAGTTDIVFS